MRLQLNPYPARDSILIVFNYDGVNPPSLPRLHTSKPTWRPPASTSSHVTLPRHQGLGNHPSSPSDKPKKGPPPCRHPHPLPASLRNCRFSPKKTLNQQRPIPYFTKIPTLHLPLGLETLQTATIYALHRHPQSPNLATPDAQRSPKKPRAKPPKRQAGPPPSRRAVNGLPELLFPYGAIRHNSTPSLPIHPRPSRGEGKKSPAPRRCGSRTSVPPSPNSLQVSLSLLHPAGPSRLRRTAATYRLPSISSKECCDPCAVPCPLSKTSKRISRDLRRT